MAKAHRAHAVETLAGRLRYLSASSADASNRQDRQAINSVIQGSAADLLKCAMILLWEKLEALGCDIIVDENGHLMGALGIAILAGKGNKKKVFDFSVEDMVFKTREINCGRCPNNCEIICVYRDDMLIDSWGNRCDKGALKAGTRTGVK